MITVFGSRGQLGREVVRIALERGHNVETDTDFHRVDRFSTVPEVWINCIGVLRNDQYGYTPHSSEEMVKANAMVPWELASRGVPMIHVSTDSVFSGREGMGMARAINEQPIPSDLYGMTKLVGEQIATLPNTTVVRTSFLGPKTGLLRMVIDAYKNGEKTLNGHCRSYWSGSTVYAVAEALVNLAEDPERPTGIQHLATLWPISKAQVLQTIVEVLGLQMTVQPVMEPFICRGLVATLPLKELEISLRENVVRLLNENLVG